MPRKQTVKQTDRKLSYTVSLSQTDRNKLVKQYKSLTEALKSLLKDKEDGI